MSDDDYTFAEVEPTRVCAGCGLLTDNGHICPGCAPWDRVPLCETCARKCAECGEWYCAAHIDEDATICNGCKTIGRDDELAFPFSKNH